MDPLADLYADGSHIEVVESVIEVETGGGGVGYFIDTPAVYIAEPSGGAYAWPDLDAAVEAVKAAQRSEKVASVWPDAPMPGFKQMMTRKDPLTPKPRRGNGGFEDGVGPARDAAARRLDEAFVRQLQAEEEAPWQEEEEPQMELERRSKPLSVQEGDCLNLLETAAATTLPKPPPPLYKRPKPATPVQRPRKKRRRTTATVEGDDEDGSTSSESSEPRASTSEERRPKPSTRPELSLRRSERKTRRNPRYSAGEEEAGWQCPDCPDRFRQRSWLLEHQATEHADVERHFCDLCGDGFPSVAERRAHLYDAHAPELPVCEVCGRRLLNALSLATHRRAEHGARASLSETSSGSGPRRGKKRPRCSECGAIAGDRTTLRRHMALAHPGLPDAALPPIFACLSCEKSFESAGGLSAHERSVHGLGLSTSEDEVGTDPDEGLWEDEAPRIPDFAPRRGPSPPLTTEAEPSQPELPS